MDWVNAIEQLRQEGFFGDIVLFHNGNNSDIEGNQISYAELEILEDSTLTDVKPEKQVLIDAHARWAKAESEKINRAKESIWNLSEEEMLTHIDSSVIDFASAKVVIKEMARMLAAIRAQSKSR